VSAQRLWFRPWVLATAASAAALAAAELIIGTGGAGVAHSWIGAVVGTVLLPVATQLGLLVGSVLFGLRVRHVVIGAMRQIGSFKRGEVTFTFRALPVTLRAQISPWRSPVIPRCWLAGLFSALAGFALVGGSWLLVSGGFSRGFALSVTGVMLYKLWPQRVPLTTSTGWLLFSLPRLGEPERSEFLAAPLAARAYAALRRGDIDQAAGHADELSERFPGLNVTMSCQVAVMEARGDYAPGVLTLLKYLSDNDVAPRKMSYLLVGIAGLGFKAVEAGQLPADSVLPTARKALSDAVSLGYPEFELNGTNGLLALIDGDAETAAQLAEKSAEYNHSPLSRADDFVTLARAHIARHDNAAARTALGRAEELAPWSPRVTETRQRLSVG
jgi:hypothetical protein